MVDKAAVAIMIVVVIVFIFVFLGLYGYFNIGSLGGPTSDCTGKCNFDGFCGFFIALGFPECWLQTNTFIWYAFLPLAAVWMIIFGFLDRVRIFKASINAALAFLIAFSMIPLGVFVLIISFVFGIMGIYSTFLFVILFFAGTALYSRGLFNAWKGVYGGFEKQMSNYDRKIANAEGEIARLTAEIDDCSNKRGKYHGFTDPQVTDMLTNHLGPTLLNAKGRLTAEKAKKKFLQEQSKRVKKTFDLETK
jgi:hypothetical protein